MQASPVHQLIGQHIGSCYVERLLSRGRLNAVYLAQQPMHRRYVAITTFMVPEQLSAEARSRFLARFMKEAALLVTLNHPHILPVYEYGEQMGCPYLVTPYVTEGSLADILNQRGRCTPDEALFLLEQIAVALEYARNKGVVHGMLKPGYVLLREKQKVQVAGFGLARILELRGIEHSSQPHAHMLSIGGTLLGAPEYSAPEWIVGEPLSPRSDIYALGILLFELLNGSPPFTGTQPFEVMMQHVQQPLPSLGALRPDVPASVELVLSRALARDPAQRFSSPQEFVMAFTDALKRGAKLFNVAPSTRSQSTEASYIASQVTSPTARIPETSNIAHMIDIGEQNSSLPQTPGGGGTFSTEAQRSMTQSSPYPGIPLIPPSPSFSGGSSPIGTASSQLVNAQIPDAYQESLPGKQRSINLPAATAPTTERVSAQPLMWNKTASLRSRRSPRTKRRRVVALLATAGIATGIAGVVGFEAWTHGVGNATHPQAASNAATRATNGQGRTTSTKKSMKPIATTGKVVGTANLATNTSATFTNPADGKQSLLVHLPDGTFAAYESACTHQGVTVAYDPETHMLVCPAHGSIFDPAHGGSVVQGPAMQPLPKVVIHVNTDGSITTN